MAYRKTDQLIKLLKEASQKVNVDEVYQHYKTKGKYKVVALALQESSGEPCVIYQSLDSPDLVWVRDIEIWNEIIESDGKKVKRFTRVHDY